jgi:branched-subunit amino acid aminotransferase/4-amino-4-deoxychorismate lyase
LKPLYCFAQNQISLLENAGVPVGDLLVQRGYGIFDYLRVANNKPLFIDAHLDRLFNSAKIMRLNIAQSKEELKKLVAELIDKNNIPFSGIRLIIAGGDAPDGYTISAPHLIIIQQPLDAPPTQISIKGIHLVSHFYQRQLAEVKTTDYLMAIHLQAWMKSVGGDDILYYNNDSVSECPRSNIFMVSQDNTIVTPAKNMLKGITRKNIITVAQANGLKIEQRDISLSEMKKAKEVFISSSTKRIIPVSGLDEQKFSLAGPNSISAQIFDHLLALEG